MELRIRVICGGTLRLTTDSIDYEGYEYSKNLLNDWAEDLNTVFPKSVMWVEARIHGTFGHYRMIENGKVVWECVNI